MPRPWPKPEEATKVDTEELAMLLLGRLIAGDPHDLPAPATQIVIREVLGVYQDRMRELEGRVQRVIHSDQALSAFPDYAEALSEAVGFLQGQGYIVAHPSGRGLFVSRLGRQRHAMFEGTPTATEVRAAPSSSADAGANTQTRVPATNSPPRVAISYAHRDPNWDPQDSQVWRNAIETTAALLEANGFDVRLDGWANRPTDWGRFGARAIKDADFVLVMVSEGWRCAWENEGKPTPGATNEADVLRDLLDEDREKWRPRIVHVLLPGVSELLIPHGLRSGYERVAVPALNQAGVTDLLRLLSNQPASARPPRGAVPDLPPAPPRTEHELAELGSAVRDLHPRDLKSAPAPGGSFSPPAGDPPRLEPHPGQGAGAFNLHLTTGPFSAHLQNVGGSSAWIERATLKTPMGDFEGVMWEQHGRSGDDLGEPTARVAIDGHLIIQFKDPQVGALAQNGGELTLSVVYRRVDGPPTIEYQLTLLRRNTAANGRPIWKAGPERRRELGT